MADRPNVVFVLTDQMRAEAAGCMGNDQIQTPTLDGMADTGVLCTRTYSPNPVCSPARGSIQTGLYPHSHGVISNKIRLPTDDPSLAAILRREGYHTGYIGKWHLDGESAPGYIPPGPHRQGFEYWKGFNSGHVHLKGHPHFDAEGELYWEEGYQPAIQTDYAIDFIEEQQADQPDQPFFLFLSWGPPHTPFEAPDEYSKLYDPDDLELRPNVPDEMDTPDLREDLAEYYALVTSLDDQLDRLLGTLDEQGIADDTLVVFTSDHGEMLGSLGRERKGYPFEESVHVPLVCRYPGEIPAGRATDGIVNLVDLMPTVLSFCDAPVPDRVQGEDRASLLRDDGASESDTTFIEGMLPYDSAWRAIRTDRYMLAIDRALEVKFLFDMEEDPYQIENLAGTESAAEVEEDLYERIVDWIHRSSDYDFIAREHATRFRAVREADDTRAALLAGRGDVFDRGYWGEDG